METIDILITENGTVQPEEVILGNRYENNDALLAFYYPEDYKDFYKYFIFVKESAARAMARGRAAVTAGSNNILPITDNSLLVSSALTWTTEDWYCYVMFREQELDLNQDTIDISAKNGERLALSDGFVGVVNKNYIDPAALQNAPLDSNLQIVYDDLMLLKKQLEDMLQGGGGVGGVITWEAVRDKPETFPPDEHMHTKSQISDMPTNLSDFSNDVGFLTAVPEDYITETETELSKKANISDFVEMANSDILAIANQILFTEEV